MAVLVKVAVKITGVAGVTTAGGSDGVITGSMSVGFEHDANNKLINNKNPNFFIFLILIVFFNVIDKYNHYF
jgi:hypothetical protein